MIRASLTVCLLLVTLLAKADIEIHKCVDTDGGIAYQQTPCPEPQEKPEIVEAEEPAKPVEVDEQLPQVAVASNRSADEVEACKEPLRDAIDAIEAEMLLGFSPQQGEEFKVKLRTLTQEMRACG